jgi:hypothetical protein
MRSHRKLLRPSSVPSVSSFWEFVLPAERLSSRRKKNRTDISRCLLRVKLLSAPPCSEFGCQGGKVLSDIRMAMPYIAATAGEASHEVIFIMKCRRLGCSLWCGGGELIEIRRAAFAGWYVHRKCKDDASLLDIDRSAPTTTTTEPSHDVGSEHVVSRNRSFSTAIETHPARARNDIQISTLDIEACPAVNSRTSDSVLDTLQSGDVSC